MQTNILNFVSGVITCLLHYRGKMAKDSFNKAIFEKQNPNSDKPDMVLDRSNAEFFFQKCLPFTPRTIMENKLLLRSDDLLLPQRMFDDSNYIFLHYDIGKLLRNKAKVGFRQTEVDYIKKKVIQTQKWAFALAEFNVVLSYRTIDEQGFVLIAEVLGNENKFDKAIRIIKTIYERLGIKKGDEYIGYLPEMKNNLSHDELPFSFDENYLFGYLDEQGKFFGSFDCVKVEGNADIVLDEKGMVKQADFGEVELKFPYAEEMRWFEEKKYNVLETQGINCVIKGGIKEERDWIVPPRQLTFTQDGIKIIYNNTPLENDNRERCVSEEQIETLNAEFGNDGNIFTVIDSNGSYEPCNLHKLKKLCRDYEFKGLMDVPILYFGGYKKKETETFIPTKYVLLALTNLDNVQKVKSYLQNSKNLSVLRVKALFCCQEYPNTLFVLCANKTKSTNQSQWDFLSDAVENTLAIKRYMPAREKDFMISLPVLDSLWFADNSNTTEDVEVLNETQFEEEEE